MITHCNIGVSVQRSQLLRLSVKGERHVSHLLEVEAEAVVPNQDPGGVVEEVGRVQRLVRLQSGVISEVPQHTWGLEVVAAEGRQLSRGNGGHMLSEEREPIHIHIYYIPHTYTLCHATHFAAHVLTSVTTCGC